MNIDRYKKIFSLQDLLEMGLVRQKDLDALNQYLEAKKFVDENFKGMF